MESNKIAAKYLINKLRKYYKGLELMGNEKNLEKYIQKLLKDYEKHFNKN